MLYKENNSLIRFFNSEILKIEPWGKNSLRVRCSPEGRFSGKDRALTQNINKGNAKITIDEECGEIVNGNARATVDKNGKVTIYNQNGKIVLEEALRLQPLKTPARFFKPNRLGKHQLTMSFESDRDEKIFGMGQYQHEFLKGLNRILKGDE